MNKNINFNLFESILNQYNGQTVITTFRGCMTEHRMFEHFEFALHKNETGYFLGSTDEESLDIEIEKEHISDYEWVEPDELTEIFDNPTVTIIFDDVNFLEMIFVKNDEEPKERCSKCGNILNKNEDPCIINYAPSYGSKFDGMKVELKICNDCFDEMFSSIIPKTDDGGYAS